MQKAHSRCVSRHQPVDPLSGQFQHPMTSVETIDFNLWMKLQQFTQKSSIRFPRKQHPPRAFDFSEARNPTVLERVAKGNRFQRLKPRSDQVKAHTLMMKKTSIGISRTR